MGVDKTTVPRFLNICVEDSKKYLDSGRTQAEENELTGNKDEPDYLQFTEDKHSIEGEEYYFEDGNIHISCIMQDGLGQTQVFLEIPLSDTVLIDILAHSIKKFNKLKSVIESLN